MIIEKINSPKDLKSLTTKELTILCDEIRGVLLAKLSEHGGHIASNLGIVELTTALHYVFNSPIDKIVFDVSHQSYVHKILTGRKEAFLEKDKYDDVSGYSAPSESEHDLFILGHTSTSLSLACGLAKARDLKGEKYNIIAVIGDGSLSGGEAYEGLNNIAQSDTNTIVIVNDNEMSIAENHGGLYQNLQDLRESNGKCEYNFFKALGLEYHYIEEGNDVAKLISALSEIKDSKKPVVLHVHTLKGKGYNYAEKDKEKWHWGLPFDLKTGESKVQVSVDYNELTANYLLKKIKQDSNVVVITSGTPSASAFTKKRREEAGAQFVDVGIAEEHAIAYASGITKNGAKAIYPVYSSFVQRTYDQISQDLCINNSPAVLIIFAGSVYGLNDVTHLGLYDITMMSNIPNLVYLAPTCKEEYFAMLDYAISQKEHPIAIKVPGGGVISREIAECDYSKINKFEITHQGEKIAILALGTFYHLGEQILDELSKHGLNATLINPKFITGIDKELLEKLKSNHELVITIEDGILEGGFGEKIASFYGTSKILVKNYGIKKSFPDRFVAEELLRENGISLEQITADILTLLNIK